MAFLPDDCRYIDLILSPTQSPVFQLLPARSHPLRGFASVRGLGQGGFVARTTLSLFLALLSFFRSSLLSSCLLVFVSTFTLALAFLTYGTPAYGMPQFLDPHTQEDLSQVIAQAAQMVKFAAKNFDLPGDYARLPQCQYQLSFDASPVWGKDYHEGNFKKFGLLCLVKEPQPQSFSDQASPPRPLRYRLYLVARGSQIVEDLMRDLHFLKTPVSADDNDFVHTGFFNHYITARDGLKAQLEKIRHFLWHQEGIALTDPRSVEFVLAGHSLGGAFVTLMAQDQEFWGENWMAACDSDREEKEEDAEESEAAAEKATHFFSLPQVRLITFGSPRVLSQTLVTRLLDDDRGLKSVHRFVNPGDWLMVNLPLGQGVRGALSSAGLLPDWKHYFKHLGEPISKRFPTPTLKSFWPWYAHSMTAYAANLSLAGQKTHLLGQTWTQQIEGTLDRKPDGKKISFFEKIEQKTSSRRRLLPSRTPEHPAYLALQVAPHQAVTEYDQRMLFELIARHQIEVLILEDVSLSLKSLTARINESVPLKKIFLERVLRPGTPSRAAQTGTLEPADLQPLPPQHYWDPESCQQYFCAMRNRKENLYIYSNQIEYGPGMRPAPADAYSHKPSH